MTTKLKARHGNSTISLPSKFSAARRRAFTHLRKFDFSDIFVSTFFLYALICIEHGQQIQPSPPATDVSRPLKGQRHQKGYRVVQGAFTFTQAL